MDNYLLTSLNKQLRESTNGVVQFVRRTFGDRIENSLFSARKEKAKFEEVSYSVLKIYCKFCKYFVIQAVTFPACVFVWLQLPYQQHPLFGIRNHFGQASHIIPSSDCGFKYEVLHACKNAEEVYRLTEIECLKHKVLVTNLARGANAIDLSKIYNN